MPVTVRKGLVVGLLSIIPACMFLRGHTYKLLMDFYQHSKHLKESPCACQKCLSDYDPWFMERFNKSIDPFLTRKNDLSEDDYRWWKHIQYDEHGRGFSYGAEVEKLFNFFPDNVAFMDSSPWRCRTCAVVGNSGNLNRSRYGPLIDTHDVIIRMNGAPVKGHEVDVGSQTTLHVMYPESAIDLDDTTRLVLFAFKVTDIRWLVSAFTTGVVMKTYQPVKAKIKANKDLVMVLNPAFMRYVHEKWLGKTGRYPSTGFLALILSMHICDEVNVFGFGADNDGNWNHYWEKLKNKKLKTGVHGGMNEFKLISQLSDKGKIHFFRGW